MDAGNIQATLLDTVLALSAGLDLTRVKYPFHHRQTAYISWHLGRELGLSPAEMEELLVSALLHDSALLWGEEEEVEEIYRPTTVRVYRHAIMGYLLMSDFPLLSNFFPSLPRIILHHHTKWKEAEEPESSPILQVILSATGEGIPLASYIIHLGGTVSRLLEPTKFVLEQAKDIRAKIGEFSGTFFPPEIVDAFMSISGKEHFWLDLVSPYIEDFIREMVTSLVYILGREEVKAIARLFCDFTDFKSQFTAVHSRGVAVVARELVKLSSLSQDEIELIEIAGYVHDFGKLAIPKKILEKPGKLSEKEFNLVKMHPYYVHLVLSRIEGLKEIASWASYHHERLDGSGYPFHLKGEEIPLEARILAVADVFSALREKRPYRPVMDKDLIFKVLGEEAKGGKLDPEIVSLLFKDYEEIDAHLQDIFLTAMERYQTIWERFSSLLAGDMDIAF